MNQSSSTVPQATAISSSEAQSSEEQSSESDDQELIQITEEEERVNRRITDHLANLKARPRAHRIDYDAELLALRDQIHEARTEDIPPLLEEMGRLSAVAARRAMVTEGVVDARSPYFGRMILEEEDRRREVLIGKTTYLDTKTGVRIVDWRDAPISRLYYRYREGEDYDEEFGGREVYGEIAVRRSIAINDGRLKRIGSPQGQFLKRADESWRRLNGPIQKLKGGQGAAMRAEAYHKPGRLGMGRDAEGREERYLPEITALIDPRQFELITASQSGLVVIQGGAGSGKTTIGLHRLAYLSFQDKRRFRPDAMLVMVFNRALQRYISRVLPSLGVPGVPVMTYEGWAQKRRIQNLPGLAEAHEEGTPSAVTRLKKHPLMLTLMARHVEALEEHIEDRLRESSAQAGGEERVLEEWHRHADQPLTLRLDLLRQAFSTKKGPSSAPLALRHAVDRSVTQSKRESTDVLGVWSEILTDEELLKETFVGIDGESAMLATELRAAYDWCRQRCPLVVASRAERLTKQKERAQASRTRKGFGHDRHDDEGKEEEPDDALLDPEDDALLLRLHQLLVGPLRSKGRNLSYAHILIDEAQDMSPVELAVVVDTSSGEQSVTLAGDVAQRLLMDNGFTTWSEVLENLNLNHVEVEPLKITYRSTSQIIDFARQALGELAPNDGNEANRQGAPVELFEFSQSGEAVAFLGEALRNLMMDEPLASVAVVSRFTEQADLYYEGLKNAEVPRLRRIADQDFPFKPGIDVTDVRQVKGLEFDYVVVLEVSSSCFPATDEVRHLLHIAATRAAHQLWITYVGRPSALLPASLRDRVQ